MSIQYNLIYMKSIEFYNKMYIIRLKNANKTLKQVIKIKFYNLLFPIWQSCKLRGAPFKVNKSSQLIVI